MLRYNKIKWGNSSFFRNCTVEAMTNDLQKQIYLRPNSIVSCVVHLVGRELWIWQEVCHLTWNDQLSFRVDGARATRNDKVISDLPETSATNTAVIKNNNTNDSTCSTATITKLTCLHDWRQGQVKWDTCLFTELFQWWHNSLADVNHSILAWADTRFEIFAVLVSSVNSTIKWLHGPYTVLVGRPEVKRKKTGHLPG